ncbi:MAG: AmpG family muropeptide MFS transporter [Gemmatimonadaceae bacterium]|nr:AmpG family muropeptide MFS transporter [Gemmatimonadaceae bacterium]
MLALMLLGFSSGLPLLLTSKTLQAWMTVAKVDLTTIGLFSLVALPYSLKFLWAPLLDRFVPPFLGRRRGWLLITQILLIIAIGAMSTHNPQVGLQMLAVNAFIIAFLSASQDIAVDAYRTDVLDHREMGAGASVWVMGYRIALIVTGSFAFLLADRMPWPKVYIALSGLMLVGILGSFFGPEPVLRDEPPKSLGEAVRFPFQEFFQRAGFGQGIAVLAFIVFYKFSDGLAGNMATPFLLQTGFSQTEIGVVLGGIGMISTIIGVLLGGTVVAKLGINRALWLFAVFQALSNFAYYGLAIVGKNTTFMTGAIVVENIGQGFVTAALLAFLMSVCNKKYSATQFALLSSLMSASRDIIVAPGGKIAESVGWPMFFIITVFAIIPAVLLLPIVAPWGKDAPTAAAPHSGEAVTSAA